eukprot:466198-Prorocentrum_minimum.AAC.34
MHLVHDHYLPAPKTAQLLHALFVLVIHRVFRDHLKRGVDPIRISNPIAAKTVDFCCEVCDQRRGCHDHDPV